MKEIIIQGQGTLLRAALFDEGKLTEVFEEEVSRLAGSIYRGRVENVLPGMQAAFVDIGLEKNAFLYVGDVVPLQRTDDERTPTIPPVETLNISRLLRSGQEVLVQIAKEPVGSKGARVTTNLTLPGRYAVIMPTVDHVGVSRKILDEKERERLSVLAEAARPSKIGVVMRTLAVGVTDEDIIDDIRCLSQLWQEIREKTPNVSIPGLVHRDVDLISRLVRDFIDDDVVRITVDDESIADMLRRALAKISHPARHNVIMNYTGDLFTKYDVDYEIQQALRGEVCLKSGGTLVIQETEALVVVDVNTGKYTGNKSLAETVLHTNLEAVEETARQLRLRNLGGIIIIDLIDMDSEEDRQKVLDRLESLCHSDKTKCHILGLTQLGLVEMTRKKTGQTLSRRYTKACPECTGTGRIPRISLG